MSYFLAFGFIGICIFAGVFLRAKIPFLQKYLVPSCMIGGLAGMIVLNLNLIPLPVELFHAIAYHFFIISFISIGLTGGGSGDKKKGAGKEVARGAFWMGLINAVSMSSQALLGCLLILLFGIFGLNLPLQFGLFLPLGFTQGPGQALAVGKAWEATGFTSAVTIGLAFAAVGFFFALFIGIPLVNWGVRKGYTKLGHTQLPDYFKRGYYRPEEVNESIGMMTTHPGNVEALAFQAGAVGIVYLLTYLGYYLVEQVAGTLSSATWGFFFFYAMLVAILCRFVMNKLKIGYMLNPQTQTGITGFAVDILVAATLISVELAVVWDYVVPLAVITLVGGLWTTCCVVYFGRRLPGEQGFERMVVQFGVNTGTVSTGLVLLRVIDPQFRTSVALETGLYAIFALPFILGTMLVIVYSNKWGLTLYPQMGIYLGVLILALALLKVFRMWGKKNW